MIHHKNSTGKDKVMEENNITLVLNPYTLLRVDPPNVLIQDKYGTIAKVNESLLTDNHIPVENGIIRININLYKAWFGDSYKKEEPSEQISFKKFVDNLDLILDSKNIILDKPKIFMAKLPFSYFASTWSGSSYLTLGVLIKAWESDKLDYQCPYCNNMLKLLNVGGFPGSGTHTAMGYCFSCKRLNRLKTEHFSEYYNKFRDAKKQYESPGKVVEVFTFEEALAVLKYLKDC